MKLLVIGGDGMAGHVIKDYFLQETDNEVFWTTRRKRTDNRHCLYLDVRDDERLKEVLDTVQPDVVINAVGLLNDHASERIQDAILVNSILPHRLSAYAKTYQFYFIHISTDCVFSGKKGDYAETDEKDGETIYAKTKSLGEVTGDGVLTIRTSIVGPELKKNGIGLFHWFMNQKGEIQGYQNVFWNGVTTLELAKAIHRLIPFRLEGLIHVTGNRKISKYELLTLFQTIFNKKDVTIVPTAHIKSDKSLKITRIDVPYEPKDYTVMLTELKRWMEARRQIYADYLDRK